jgi:HEAT repeat-containing protein 5
LRDICFALYQQLKNDEDPLVVVEAVKCVQNFIMFAPKNVDIPKLIPFLQVQINGNVSVIRRACVTCLYQLTQRDPSSVLSAAINHQLEEQLFGLLDIEIDSMIRAEIKDILTALLRHVAPAAPSRCIELCKNILAKASATTKTAATQETEHEEYETEESEKPAPVAKLAQPKQEAAMMTFVLLPRWRTQVFAIQCLCTVVNVTLETKISEHSDLALARLKKAESVGGASDYLVFKIQDLIRLAFNSSTANVSELRSGGLMLLRDILERFLSVPDPDFEGHALLEQYEAQIVSALAPAFSVESHPLITSSACRVCAYFIGSGISQDILNLSRPIKLLSTVLEDFSSTASNPRGNCPANALTMIKVSMLAGWSDIYSASRRITDLSTIINDKLPQLMKLWMLTLEDYGKLVLAETTDSDLGEPGVSNGVYESAIREVTLPVFFK